MGAGSPLRCVNGLAPLHGERQDAEHPEWGPPQRRKRGVCLPHPTLTASPSVPPHKREGGRMKGYAKSFDSSARVSGASRAMWP